MNYNDNNNQNLKNTTHIQQDANGCSIKCSCLVSVTARGNKHRQSHKAKFHFPLPSLDVSYVHLFTYFSFQSRHRCTFKKRKPGLRLLNHLQVTCVFRELSQLLNLMLLDLLRSTSRVTILTLMKVLYLIICIDRAVDFWNP